MSFEEKSQQYLEAGYALGLRLPPFLVVSSTVRTDNRLQGQGYAS